MALTEASSPKPVRSGAGKAVRTILSIDGGGIRGIIPALVLAEIERRTGKPTADLFDLVAGTSTGGIVAVGLNVPDSSGRPRYSAMDMVRLYEEHGARIFHRQWWRQALSWIYGAAYSPRSLEDLLHEYARETRLSEAVTGLLVTSWELRSRTAWFFRRAQARAEPAYDCPMHQVARATSAAPTYFPPLRFRRGADPHEYALVDGGVFANNPGVAAWVDAHEGVLPDQDVFMVSLGTGSVNDPITYAQGRRWGKLVWARPVIGVLLDGVSDTVEYELERLLSKDRYYRFQTDIPAPNRAIDDASTRNLKGLRMVAEAMIEKQADDLTAVCKRLQQLAPITTAPDRRSPP